LHELGSLHHGWEPTPFCNPLINPAESAQRAVNQRPTTKNHLREVALFGCSLIMGGWLIFLVIPIGLYFSYEHIRVQRSSAQ